MSVRSLIPESAFDEGGTLDREYHAKLLANVDEFMSLAGIRANFLWEPAKDYLSNAEIDWVKHFKSSDDSGLLLLSKNGVSTTDAVMAIGAAFLRNYIDARVMTLANVIQALQDGDHENLQASVLLIPDFCMSETMKDKSFSGWKAQMLADLLLHRYNSSHKTVLVSNTDGNVIRTVFGTFLWELIENNYYTVNRG